MTAEALPAIRSATVLAAMGDLDVEDRRTANVVWNLGLLRSLLNDISPYEAEEVAAYLFTLLEREPAKSAKRYAAHRMIIGSLASELRTYARDAGEPVGLWRDLRDANSQAEEQRILLRLDEQALAFSRVTDDAIAAGRIQRPAAPEPVVETADEPPDDFVLP